MIVVTRLLDHRATFFPRTYCLGEVEIRNSRCDTAEERAVLSTSCTAFGDEDQSTCMRMVTLIDTRTLQEADAIGEERFEEALDSMGPTSQALSRSALLQAGLFRIMHTGALTARVPSAKLQPTTMFRVMREPFPRCELPQLLLGAGKCELTTRLLRSYHWSRKANLEGNRQLRVIFRWFAMEAIWMLGKEDDIVPRVMWAVGFPTGQGAALLSPSFTARLGSHPTYGSWRAQVEKHLYQIRQFRHDSVHSGFRSMDIARSTLRDFDQLVGMACARVQRLASDGIVAGIQTTGELFEYLPIMVEADANYVGDIHRTVIYSLEHPNYWR